MKKKLFAWILLAVLVLGLCVPAMADFDPATRDSVAVVYTCLDLDQGEYGFGWGSCFFVGDQGQDPQYLVTNYHVIADFVDYGQGELVSITVDGVAMQGRSKIRVYYDSKDYEEAYVVGYDSIKDLAVLKLGAPTNKRKSIPIQAAADSMVGGKVYAVGYPGLAENVFADATTSWGKADSTVTSGTISRLFLTSGTGVSSIQVDCEFKQGNSGGPLVYDDGSVIGVNTYLVNDGSNNVLRYSINASEVITLLNQLTVPYTTKSQAAAQEDGEPTPVPEPEKKFPVIPVVAGVAGLAVIGAVLGIVLSKKKKKAAEEAAKLAQQQQQAQLQMQQMQQQMQRQQMQQRQAQVRKGYVRSLAPQHGGSRIAVSGQITLGRNQNCAVVYQSGTPGVSGNHASLSFDPQSGEFVLVDLNSTYGTYLGAGQKLTPNMTYRLRSGDRFYLGETGNMLEVSVE